MSFLDNIENTTSHNKNTDNMRSGSDGSQTKDKLENFINILIEAHQDKQEWFSSDLDKKITALQLRFYEPMKIAIIGQFSSGKSTFLNALLSRNILPSGITPVTSKVNYIKYGKEIKLEIKFKGGRKEFYDINSIASLTDQRNKKNTHDIKYLTLYYPLEILKKITFVDTPGLNSTSGMDTKTTEDILDSVDGIIWVTLIDNAAKNSEKIIVKKTLKKYSNKALCIVNQKDKKDVEEVEDMLDHVNNEWGDFFTKIEAISSKQALEARGSSKNTLTSDLFNSFTENLNKDLKKIIDPDCTNNINEISEIISNQSKEMALSLKEINTHDISKNKDLLKESNIQSVLDFIDKEIKPQHTQSKLFSINNEMKHIAHSMIDQNKIFINILDDLKSVITTYDKQSSDEFDKYLNTYIKQANNTLTDKIGYIIHESHAIIMDSFIYFPNTKIIHTIDEGFFSDSDKVEYKSYGSACICYKQIDDQINSQKFQSLIDQYMDDLEKIKVDVTSKYRDVNKILANNLSSWRDRSLDKLKITDHLHSEELILFFKNNFISNKFEKIFNKFEMDILDSIKDIELAVQYLSISVGWSYRNAIYSTVGFINYRISQDEYLYEKNDENFTLPTADYVQNYLNGSFSKDKLHKYLSNKYGFICDSINTLNKYHTTIANDKVEKINRNISILDKENNKLQNFINNLNTTHINPAEKPKRVKPAQKIKEEPVFICI